LLTVTLAGAFPPLAEKLATEEATIVGELAATQGTPVEIGGYYQPDAELVAAAMRPSPTLNAALATL
jgi:isocitrate dehydrogenase